jgi:hypothetical protein
MPTIQEAIDAAAPGDVIGIPAGVYDAADVVLPSNITLVADGDVTIVGNLIVNGSNTVVEGFTFDGGMVDLGYSQNATVRDCIFNGGQNSINYSWANGPVIANNEFNNVSGNVLEGWEVNEATISGNRFANVTQGINLNFNNNPAYGNDIVIEQNTFTNTARMPIEVGPGGAYTSNLVVRDNWSDNSNVTNPVHDGGVAYSIISTNGVNTLIEGNYAKGPEGPGIGIEMAGTGEIRNNYVDTFQFGIVVYGDGPFSVHDNATFSTPIESVLNYHNGDGVIANNTSDDGSIAPPPPPVASADGEDPVAPTDPGPVDAADGDGTTAPPVDAADADGTTAPPVDAADGDGTTSPDVGVVEPSQPVEPTPDPSETPADSYATVWGRGFRGEDPALAASDADELQAAYQSAIDERDSAWIRFNVEGSAALDQDSISLRDEALVGLDAANPALKIGFTVTARSTGLDAGSLNVLQSAINDGVHIDAVKILVQDPEQQFGDTRAELRGAAAATREQLADLGLDATVRFAWDQDGAASAEAAAADTGGTTVQPFEFSGVLNQQQVDQIG